MKMINLFDHPTPILTSRFTERLATLADMPVIQALYYHSVTNNPIFSQSVYNASSVESFTHGMRSNMTKEDHYVLLGQRNDRPFAFISYDFKPPRVLIHHLWALPDRSDLQPTQKMLQLFEARMHRRASSIDTLHADGPLHLLQFYKDSGYQATINPYQRYKRIRPLHFTVSSPPDTGPTF